MKKLFLFLTLFVLPSTFALADTSSAVLVPTKHNVQRHHAHKATRHHAPKHPRRRV